MFIYSLYLRRDNILQLNIELTIFSIPTVILPQILLCRIFFVFLLLGLYEIGRILTYTIQYSSKK
jgi:hypothetical protein